MDRLIVAMAALLTATVAGAGEPVPVPEPGIIELLALGGVVAVVLALRNRRK
jgi:hypothetical protein